jgi:hypothetical protein
VSVGYGAISKNGRNFSNRQNFELLRKGNFAAKTTVTIVNSVAIPFHRLEFYWEETRR